MTVSLSRRYTADEIRREMAALILVAPDAPLLRIAEQAAEDAARLEQMRDWLKAEGESNYETWSQPTQEPIPTVGDLARMGRCDGTNAFIAKASRKMFDLWPELFQDVEVIDLSSSAGRREENT